MSETGSPTASAATHRTTTAAANPSAPLILAGLAAAGPAIPIALIAALPGLVFTAGFDHLAYGLGLLAGVVLAGLLIAPHVAEKGAATIPDALRRRFGRATATIAAVVVVLVALPLLTADLVLAAMLAENVLGVPYTAAVLAAISLAAVAALCLGDRGFGWLAVSAYGLLALGLLVPLMAMAFKTQGFVLPHIAFGAALESVDGLEQQLLENGLVDFDTFGVHVTPFLRLFGLDLFALVAALALGTAVLPPLVSALAAPHRASASRLAGAWTALFVMLILISIPPLAAYAKLAIYGAIADATPLAALPSWLERPLAADLAHIHGTSLAMLDQVAKAVAAGSSEPKAIADHLAAYTSAMQQRWVALSVDVQSAIVEAARALGANASATDLWQSYVGRVLPAAASAAFNEAAILTQAALVIEPAGLLLALPALSGVPGWAGAMLLAGVIAAALVVGVALIRALLALDAREQKPPRQWRRPALALIIAVLAATIASLLRPGDLVGVVVSALSLAAAGLFPVLALGLVWKRATALGAMAAIVAGAGVTLYYDVGIRVFPAAFYRTWAPLSNAGEFAIEEFEALETEAREAASPAEAEAAHAALEKLARGSATRPGLANWAGIDPASAAVFGVPAGFLALVLVSLVTSSGRRSETDAVHP